MTSAPTQALTDHVQVLFGVGTCAGMTDGQLLEHKIERLQKERDVEKSRR
jgi:hypothetical protein